MAARRASDVIATFKTTVRASREGLSDGRRFHGRAAGCVLALMGLVCILAMLGTAASAQSFNISPSSITFHTTVVGTQTAVQPVTVTNTGTTPLVISSFTLSPFNVFVLEYGWTRTLQPKQFGNWAIRFRPSAGGPVTGQMTFTIQGVSQPQVVNLSGTGATTSAAASVSPNILNFPNTVLGSTSSQTVTVTNTGTNGMHLSSVTVLPPFSQTGFTTPVALTPGKSFSFHVNFTPTVAIPYANAISVGYDVLPAQTISVAGNGIAPSAAAVSSAPTLPTGARGFDYLVNFTGSGGTPPYTWSDAGKLPGGLTFSSNGSLRGSLNVASTGNYRFTVQFSDSSKPKQYARQLVTLPVTTASSSCNNITWDQAGTSNPLVDLPDLGTGSYLGSEGGLYPGGSNVRPPTHEADGLALADSIVPLDASGNYDPNGKYVLLGLGVSILRTMFSTFQLTEQGDPTLNPNLVIVNGAIDGTDSPNWANYSDGSWQTVLDFYLPYQGVTAKQVVAAWVLIPHSQPKGTYPSDMTQQENEVISALQNMHRYFPNLKIAYLESMHYTGYATNNPVVLPEPYAYETGFAMQDIIAQQINGSPALNYNPANGPVMVPWLSWGTYDWANGMLANGNSSNSSAGLEWSCSDLGPDGVHASTDGGYKDAALVTGFLKTDETAAPWFLAASPK